MITFLIFGRTLQNAVGETELTLEVAEPTTVRKLIEDQYDRLGGLLRFIASREAIITVNKKIGSEDSPVKDGDTVKVSFQGGAAYDGTRDIPM